MNHIELNADKNGKSAAVLLNINDYEDMVEKFEILEDIKLAENQIENGLGKSHEDVVNNLRKYIC